MRYAFLAALGALLYLTAPVQAQPMVVYSVGSSLFVGTGEPGSFAEQPQDSGTIGDIAIDPSTRMIYYTDTDNGTINMADPSGIYVRIVTTTPVTPVTIRISQGVIYYSDIALTPSIRTYNLATDAESSLPIVDSLDEFVIDAKNGRVIYTTTGEEFVKSCNFDGSDVRNHDRPQTVTSSMEIYGDTLLKADFGFFGRIQSIPLSNISGSQTTVRQGVSGNGIPHDMASDFAAGVYYYLDNGSGSATGGLYRRTISATGSLDQQQIVSLEAAGGLDVLEAEDLPLTPTTTLTAPPVLVNKTQKSVTLQLREFSAVALSARRALAASRAKKKPEPTFRYEVRVKTDAARSKVIRNITTKKSVLTISNLKPGSYATDYRATIYVKKTSAQKAKARAAGKKGLALNFNKKGRTNFSPRLLFTLP